MSENFRNPKVGFSVGKAMQKAGYSLDVTKKPKILTESKGFKELCNQVGLTDKMLTSALVYDIENKPKDRSKELTLGFKVLGLLKGDNPENNPIISIPDSDFIEIIRAYKVRH